MTKPRHSYFMSPGDPNVFYVLFDKGSGAQKARLLRLGWQPVRRTWLLSIMGEKALDGHLFVHGVGQFSWTGNRAQPQGRGVLEDPA